MTSPELPDITVEVRGCLTPAKPCPHCGETELLVFENHAGAWMECTHAGCKTRGPMVATPRDALAAWNAAASGG